MYMLRMNPINRLLTGVLLFAWTLLANAVSLTGLRTEQQTNPVGVGVETPRLSWQIKSEKKNVMQTAYHILVASSTEKLLKGEGDLWDSGRIASSEAHLVSYQGKPVASNKRYYWKVKVWTTQGETAWSEPAFWTMGLLTETHWRGQWIGMDEAAPWDSETQWSRLSARYLRKEFTLTKEVKQATVHIAGMGLYELCINGAKVGDQVLAPNPTDYRKTVLYNSFDVTSLLCGKQANAIGVTLGTGRFYTMRQNFKPYKIPNFGYPKMRLNLIVEYADGTKETIVSDASWRLTADGPIRSNNEYDGEEYDANKELTGWANVGYDDAAWKPAQRVSIPDGTLRASMSPPMRVVDTLKPISIYPRSGKYILDMGQNMAGWIRFKIKGNKGDTIRLRFAELLDENGELFMENLRDARVTDTYIVNGQEPKGATWAPRFVYHGFRYVEVSGYPTPTLGDFTAEVVNDDVATMGTFQCSNPVLNRIHANAFWGIRSNYKGMPVDCPQRNERQPWLGDHAMGSWGESFLFDVGTMYAKWSDDIRDAQREDGCIPDVVPAFWNYYSDNMTWPATFLITADMVYTQYGDIRPIQKNYPAMKHWLEHMKKEYMTEGYIVTKDKYGDWCVPPESPELIHSKDSTRRTDGSLIATAYYYKMLQYMMRFARLQGLAQEEEVYSALATKVGEAFNREFLTVKQGTSPVPGGHILYPDSVFYGNNTVTANILPLAFGMVPEAHRQEVAKNVVTTIITTNKGHISTGVIGTQWLMHELSNIGRADIAYLLATNKTYPSWGYMAEQGATTIWELWNGDTAIKWMNSANHVMLLGDLISWSYEHLAGIRSDRQRVGFKHIILRPDFEIQELSKVDASYTTPYGEVVSRWTKSPMHLDWEVIVPANTSAEVHLPDGRVEQIGSGRYQYSVDMPMHKGVLADEFLYETASFPECHGSTIAELPNGDLVAAFFGGTKERNPDCVIWVCRKEKGSKQWTAPVEVADGVQSPTLRKACWNPVLYQVPGGELLLFYKIGLNVPDWTGHVIRSADGGRTWSKSEQLPDGILGPVKNKPEWIDGRIISPSSTEGEGGWRVHLEISDDRGKTWRKVGPLAAAEALPTPLQKAGESLTPDNTDDPEAGDAIATAGKHTILAIQPSILVHKDGRLQLLCRSRNGFLATAWSSDRGETWTELSLSNVPNNNSGTDAVTLKDGRHLLVYNNFRTVPGERKGPRTPLTVAMSEDGINWTPVLVLEDSPVSQYSYPSVIQGKDGKVHIVYTWRRQRIKYRKLEL